MDVSEKASGGGTASPKGWIRYRSAITPALGSGGLTVYGLLNAALMFFVAKDIYLMQQYRRSLGDTLNLTEAAVISAHWSETLVTGAMWIALAVAFGTVIVANRVTRVHTAFLSSFPTEIHGHMLGDDPDNPRAGAHSFAVADRRASHAGRDYTVHTDGVVVALLHGKPATWGSEAAFKRWVDRTGRD